MKKIRLVILSVIASNIFLFAQSEKKCVTWEKILSSGPELEQIGVLGTKHSKEIESSPWSVGCETLDRDYTIFNNYKDYVGELGVKGARIQGGWAKCEKEKGVYNFEWLDTIVYGLEEQTVKPFICLCYGNPLYSSEVRLGSKIVFDEESYAAWCKWVEAIVTRYKDVVTKWEIWNEPNLGMAGEPETYATLLIKTEETIKKIQPDATIIGFSLCSIDLDYAEKVLDILKEKNKLDIVDYLCYHPYAFCPDGSYRDVDKLALLVESYNPDIKLYQGENAAPSANHVYHALKDYPWTEYSQAKWYTRRMAGDRMRGIETSVFSIIDIKYPEVLLSMGLLRSNLLQEVVYKKPSYYAVQHMVNVFDHSVKPIGELNYESNTTEKMTVAGFEKGDNSIVLAWYNDNIPSDELEWDMIDLTIKETEFQNPVIVEMISGRVYESSNSNWENKEGNAVFRKLPMWDSAIMIVEREDIAIIF